MKFSQLVTRTSKQISQEEPSRNAQLLVRAGYVDKMMAGVYSYLPLGMRVLNNIENIIRQQMEAIDGQEVLMPALQPREPWDKTQRWDKIDVLFKLKGAGDRDFCLGPTHEEAVTPLITQFLQSYKDFPKSVYQIQTKFRNEPRAKSGLLRGREFRMKDLYSFHTNPEDLDAYYERAIQTYKKVFERCGLGHLTLVTYASGGVFSKYSHEFQAVTPYGEDVVYRVPGTDIAINKEIIDDQEALAAIIPNYQPGDESKLEEVKAIEIGNIFKLGTKFPDSFERNFVDANDSSQKIWMGCYGIGSSRVMGTIAEVLSDDKGLVWPEEVAPYKLHLCSLFRSAEEMGPAQELYQKLTDAGISVIWDDRLGVRAGQKFGDADLLGMPHRVVISSKTVEQGKVEYKARTSDDAQMLALEELIAKLS